MNNLIIALVAWWIAEGSNLVQEFKWWLSKKRNKGKCTYKVIDRLKPFDCPMCLAFWLSIIPFSIIYRGTDSFLLTATLVFTNAIVSSALAIFISKIYHRL